MAMSALAARLPDLTYDNISLHTIPWAWLISIIAPRLWGRYLYYKSTKHDMDIVHPRRYTKDVAKDTAMDEKTRGQILRCEAAMNNGLENIAIFCAAVVAGNAAGLDTALLNNMSIGYLASRVAFNMIYVWQDTFLKAALRPVAYFAGLGMCFHLFIKAGNEFSKASPVP